MLITTMRKRLTMLYPWASNGDLPALCLHPYCPIYQVELEDLRPLDTCVPLGLEVACFQFNVFVTVFQTHTIKGLLAVSVHLTREILEVVAKLRIRFYNTAVRSEKVPGQPLTGQGI
jgi:hypothetical protein